MALRVILGTLLLSLPPLLDLNVVKGSGPMPPFYFLIALTYLFTIVGIAFMARGIRHPRAFSICQLAIDLLLETALIAVTGGAESPFIFLYIISIVAGSLLFQLEGSLLTAACATFLLSVLVGFQQVRPLPFQTPILSGGREAIYLVLLYAVSFFCVGTISGRLSQRLHERETGFLDLRLLHENIVQSIASGLVTTDMSGRITSLNRHATLITGFTPQEAIGALWWELFRWDAIKNHYDAILTSGLAQRFEGELQTRDGRRCLLGVTLSILSNEADGRIGMTGIFQDLTRLRHLEGQVEKKARMAMIGEMAAGIAHEIRNPLAALSGSLQLLQESSDPRDEAGKLMQIALEETYRLNDIVTQFLCYAKPPPTHRRPSDLHLLLSEAVRLLENSRDYDRRIQVRLLTAPGPLILPIDPDQIRQLFWNLSLNAFQSMPGPEGGTLTIATRTQCTDGETPEVEIRFSDTGVGIAPDDLPNIFNPFFTTKETGSGLGLSIVQRIVEGHAGRIEVRNGEQGASFFVTLPAPALEQMSDFSPAGESQAVLSGV